MESNQTVRPSQRRRILAGAAPIHGVKSRLLEVPQFPDAQPNHLRRRSLATSVAEFRRGRK